MKVSTPHLSVSFFRLFPGTKHGCFTPLHTRLNSLKLDGNRLGRQGSAALLGAVRRRKPGREGHKVRTYIYISVWANVGFEAGRFRGTFGFETAWFPDTCAVFVSSLFWQTSASGHVWHRNASVSIYRYLRPFRVGFVAPLLELVRHRYWEPSSSHAHSRHSKGRGLCHIRCAKDTSTHQLLHSVVSSLQTNYPYPSQSCKPFQVM